MALNEVLPLLVLSCKCVTDDFDLDSEPVFALFL